MGITHALLTLVTVKRSPVKRVIIEGCFNLLPMWIVKRSHSSMRPLSVNRSWVNYKGMYRLIQRPRAGINGSMTFSSMPFSSDDSSLTLHSNRLKERKKPKYSAIMTNAFCLESKGQSYRSTWSFLYRP